MKKRFGIYLLSLLLLPLCCNAQTEVLDAFFDKMEHNTLETEFTLTVADGTSQPLSYNGALTMRGECFRLTMWNTEAAYDGTTLYMYSEDSGELTLSTPTGQEMLETNPLLFAQALRKTSTQRFATRQTKPDVHVIEFIPSQQEAGVHKFVLTLRKTDLMPLQIVVWESATQQTELRLHNPHYTQNKDNFRLTKEGAFINDLR